MLDRLIEVRRALNTVLCEPRMPDPISSREWTSVQEYKNCLQLFKEATEMLTVENKPTLPRYIPAIFGIRDTLMRMLENDSSNETAAFKTNLIMELGNRFYFATSTDYLIVSMILDPRIKDRLLSSEKKEEARETVLAFAAKYRKSSVADENVGAAAAASVSSSSSSSSLLSSPSFLSSSSPPTQSLFNFFKNVSDQEGQSSTSVLQHQLNTYLTETLISPESCILEWWRQNATRFPELAIVARNLLGIPATQAYSERLFSLAGNIVTERRSSLLSERVEQICFLSANRKT